MQDQPRFPSAQDVKSLRRVGWAMLGHACVTLLLFALSLAALAVAFAPRFGSAAKFLESPAYEDTAYILQAVVAVLGVIPFLVLERGRLCRVRESLTLRGVRAKEAILCVLLVLGMNSVGSLAVLGTEIVFNRAGYSVLMDLPMGQTTVSAGVMLAYALLIGPVAEELIFRGLLMNCLMDYAPRFAVYGSALLFALMHGNLGQFVPALLTALALGYIRVKTGSLLLPMLIHIFNNLWAVGLSEWIYPLLGGAAGTVDMVLLLALVCACVYSLRALRGRLGALSDPEGFHAPSHYLALYGSLPMIIYLAVELWNMVSAVQPLAR